MSPLQHGEVFVTDDGAETDLDLGHYERFMDVSLRQNSNVTAGRIHWSVIQKERRGDYLGGTVQVIPHVTNEIKDRIHQAAEETEAEVLLVEIGGTVGDIESLPFLEAIRQFKSDTGRDDVLYIHVTLIPYLNSSGEMKSKPTQHSVKELRSIGIQPDVIVCRTEQPMSRDLKGKIALFCDTEERAVIQNIDARSIYDVPLLLEAEGFGDLVVERLKLPVTKPNLDDWRRLAQRIQEPRVEVRIALVGKYVALKDAYLSVAEALEHAGIANDAKVRIEWIDSEEVEKEGGESLLEGMQGILVPGGFGYRGIEGKIKAIRYAREERIPFFGICLGMQAAIIEAARNLANLKGANSTEFVPETPYPVIDLMPDQMEVEDKGGTMRLGAYPCRVEPDTLARQAYGENLVQERHRHRFEVNNTFRDQLTGVGLRPTGLSPDGRLVEIAELADHPWFLGTQFHPEFKSRPNRPHPLFREFVRAALDYRERML